MCVTQNLISRQAHHDQHLLESANPGYNPGLSYVAMRQGHGYRQPLAFTNDPHAS